MVLQRLNRQGETIATTDKDGKDLRSLKVPAPIDNPRVTIHEVEINLLAEREFGHFCQNTWNRGPACLYTPSPPPTTNPT